MAGRDLSPPGGSLRRGTNRFQVDVRREWRESRESSGCEERNHVKTEGLPASAGSPSIVLIQPLRFASSAPPARDRRTSPAKPRGRLPSLQGRPHSEAE